MFVCLIYLVYLFVEMYSFDRDLYSSSILINKLDEGHNNLTITDFNFLPFIDFRKTDTWTKQQFDVFDESKWNWNDLSW